MTYDRAGDRTLLLSLGLFGIPARRDERDRETPATDASRRPEQQQSGSSR